MYCYVMVFLKSNLQCHLFVMRGRDAFGEDGMGDRQDRFIIAADHFIITMPLEGRGNHGVVIGSTFGRWSARVIMLSRAPLLSGFDGPLMRGCSKSFEQIISEVVGLRISELNAGDDQYGWLKGGFCSF